MIRIVSLGRSNKTTKYLESIATRKLFASIEPDAKKGVKALASATPVDTGKTAAAWGYKIQKSGTSITITWTNSNDVQGAPLVLLLQHGHGTGTGGYVSGRDFINPAIQPIFDEIANNVWKKVTNG